MSDQLPCIARFTCMFLDSIPVEVILPLAVIDRTEYDQIKILQIDNDVIASMHAIPIK